MSVRLLALLCVVTLGTTGCGGGSKLIKHPLPPEAHRSLAEAADPSLHAILDWVIVRDGNGAWAKNADWDEYLISLTNRSADPVRITDLAVFDSLGTRIDPRANRKELLKGSKETAHRYRASGLKTKAGMGGAGLLATGAAVGAVGYGAALGSAYGSMMGGTAAAGGVAAASAMLIAAPVFAVFGIVRAVHNSQVNNEIERRQTTMPVLLSATQTQHLDIFFPLAPSPQRIEITYVDSRGEHRLPVDIRAALAGLHLGNGQPADAVDANAAPGR